MAATSNPFRLTRLQGALLGSFFLHALLFYGLSRSGDEPQQSSVPQRSVLEVQLLPATPTLVEDAPTAPAVPEPTLAQAPTQPLPATPDSPAAAPKKAEAGKQLLPWKPEEAKVETFTEVPYPPDTVNITATMQIEVSLDKDGKATAVRVLSESPKGMFSEWAWEMGMKGQYRPKITAEGPVASTLNIRLDITPGMPLEVR